MSKWTDTRDGDVIPSVHLLVCSFVCGICGMNKQKNELTNEQMNRHTWWWCHSVCSSARLFICLRYLRYEQTKNEWTNEQMNRHMWWWCHSVCSFASLFIRLFVCSSVANMYWWVGGYHVGCSGHTDQCWRTVSSSALQVWYALYKSTFTLLLTYDYL